MPWRAEVLLNKEDSLLILVDVQQKLTGFVLDSEVLVARCEWLLKLARKIQVPVLVSQQYSKGLGVTVDPLSSYYNETECVEKVHFSCMQEPNYLYRLHQHKKGQLILIGIETHVCILQTALEMKKAGFEVFVVVDAVSSRKELDHKYALK